MRNPRRLVHAGSSLRRACTPALAGAALWGCGQGDPARPELLRDAGDADAAGVSCPTDLPAACPSPPPSFAKDVEPVIQRACNPCHGPGGIAQVPFDFSTYAGIASARSPITSQIYACRMPPAGSPAPSLSEREALLAWLVCGAPEN